MSSSKSEFSIAALCVGALLGAATVTISKPLGIAVVAGSVAYLAVSKGCEAYESYKKGKISNWMHTMLTSINARWHNTNIDDISKEIVVECLRKLEEIRLAEGIQNFKDFADKLKAGGFICE